jgi:hemoglobin
VESEKMDILSRADIDLLVRDFYLRLLEDERVAYIFVDVAKLDLEHHLPRIADFWDSLLLSNPVYEGNPMAVHLQLNDKTPLGPEIFKIWLQHFEATVRAHFKGEVAEQAIIRANSIATVMQTKIWRSQIANENGKM